MTTVTTDHPVRPQCSTTRKDGHPCRAWAGPRGLCTQHGASAETRSLWAAQGAAATNFGKQERKLGRKVEALSRTQQALEDATLANLTLPDLSSQEKVDLYIARMVAEVHAGLLPPSKSRAICELLDVKLKMVGMSISQKLLALEA